MHKFNQQKLENHFACTSGIDKMCAMKSRLLLVSLQVRHYDIWKNIIDKTNRFLCMYIKNKSVTETDKLQQILLDIYMTFHGCVIHLQLSVYNRFLGPESSLHFIDRKNSSAFTNAKQCMCSRYTDVLELFSWHSEWSGISYALD